MEDTLSKIPWINDRIKNVPYRKKLYKFMKFFLFKWKGLTYLEMYAILTKLYSNKIIDEKECKTHALNEIITIHYCNENNLV